MQRIHPIWTLVTCAAVMLAINMGIRQSFGLYLKPISQDLGLHREVFSLSMALLNLVWGAAAPFAGALSDKFGAVKVAVGGALVYVSGLILIATATSGAQLVISGVLLGVGISATGFTALFGVIARAAPSQMRSQALSLVTMGSAIGQFAALPYVHVLMDATGWVSSLYVLAATAALMIPLALSFPNNSKVGQLGPLLSQQGLTAALSEALGHRSFLLLAAGFFVCGFHIAAVATHLPAFLSDKGFEPRLGVVALTVVGAANILGTYLCGRMGEVVPRRIALAGIYLSRGVVFLCLLFLPLTQGAVLVYALALGLLWLGTIPLTTGLIVTFFGPRWLSTLYGLVFLCHQVGSFLGAWLGGRLYDAYRSYDLLWWASVAVALLAAVLHLPIRERPSPRLAAAGVTDL